MKKTASRFVSIFLSLAMAFTTYANPSSVGHGSSVVRNQVSESIELVSTSIEELSEGVVSGDLDLELLSESLIVSDDEGEAEAEDAADEMTDIALTEDGEDPIENPDDRDDTTECTHEGTLSETNTATCTEAGQKTISCSKCGYTHTEDSSAKGHAYGEWTYYSASQEQRVCANDSSHVEYRTNISEPTIVAPTDITYGESLGYPTVNSTSVTSSNGTVSVDGVDFVCRYVGVNGTSYDSTTQPTNAGQYQVVVSVANDPNAGPWTSGWFQIYQKALTARTISDSSLPVQPTLVGLNFHKTYDGTLTANSWGLRGAELDGRTNGDDETTVYLEGTCQFVFPDVNAEYNYVTVSTYQLGGESSQNYYLTNTEQFFVEGSITPARITVDATDLRVVKVMSKGDWDVTGQLRLNGVVNNEVRLNLGSVYVSEDPANQSPGTGKTVWLQNIIMEGSDKLGNYTLGGDLQSSGGDIYYYYYNEAEILDNFLPVLGEQFTVDIPPRSEYDGTPRIATYHLIDGVEGMDPDPLILYRKVLSDGSYDGFTTVAPVNPGTYKVYVSFRPMENFAGAEGDNSIEVGEIIIDKSTSEYRCSVELAISSGASESVYLSDLNLPEAVTKGATLSELVNANIANSSVIGYNGWNYIHVTTDQVREKETGSFEMTMSSDCYDRIVVEVTLVNDPNKLNLMASTLTLAAETFKGDTALKDLVVVHEDGSAELKGTIIPGTFALKDPDLVLTPNTYVDYPITLVFNSDDGQYENVETIVRMSFTIFAEDADPNDFSKMDTVYFTIYANSTHNQSPETLVELLNAKKPTHVVGDDVYLVSWKHTVTSENPDFSPQGSRDNNKTLTYLFTGTLQAKSRSAVDEGVKAYVKVVPITAVTKHENPEVKVDASKIESLTDSNWMEALGLPMGVTASYVPAEAAEDALEQHGLPDSNKWNIVGWKMDGETLTLAALKSKVASLTQPDSEIVLTPVYASEGIAAAPSWATLAEQPFKLLVHKTIAGTNSGSESNSGSDNNPGYAPAPGSNNLGGGNISTPTYSYWTPTSGGWGYWTETTDPEEVAAAEEMIEETRQVQRPRVTTATTRTTNTAATTTQDTFPYVPVMIGGGVVILGLAVALAWKSGVASGARRLTKTKNAV